MKKTSILLLVLAALSFGACSEKCEEPDIQAINALYFELQNGGDNGFSAEELDAIFFVRFIPFSEPLIADTLYPNGIYPEGEGRFLINDSYPFNNDQSPYYTVYGYMVVEPTTGYVANIENIELGGEYDGDCGYINTRKRYTVNGDTIDVSGSQVFVPLTR
ncbi:hypothetical protein G3O08_13135 [Cryomorpha ignava]|uniref:Lipoprotein n=1 Tax=Cryomorpha ignava TaxID=101383 RepID=A0A7K3WRZ7_9FLAO|nr:hypothetical protein [Cryomorpha ignava]NEN24449.1 hypothetical protein [Cryomorpha ignava]